MKLHPLKFISAIVAGQSPPGRLVHNRGGLPFLQGSAEFGARSPQPRSFCDTPPRIAPKGCWLISVRAPVGDLNFADSDYGIGRGLAAVIPNEAKVFGGFLGYALQDSSQALAGRTTGTTFGAISMGDLGNLPIPLPPYMDQKRIADFLDRQTSLIDELIEKKQRLMELLEEGRQSLIFGRVMAGNPDKPIRTGGIRAHQSAHGPRNRWPMTRLQHCVEGVVNGAWGKEPGYGEEDVICVRVADFRWPQLTIALNEPTVRSLPRSQFKRLRLQPGDILLEKSGGGERTPVGRVALFQSKKDAVSSNFIARVRPRKGVNPKFLLYILVSLYWSGFARQFIKQNTGIQNLDDKSLFETSVGLPDQETQDRIVRYLDGEITRIGNLRNKTNESIERLRELRSALITAAVTGQIGVDEWERRGGTERELERLEEEGEQTEVNQG